MTTQKHQEAVVGLDDSVTVLRRYWKPLAMSASAGFVLGLLSLVTTSDSYTSDSLVEVRPLISQSDAPNLDVSRQVNTTTEQAIASSQRVAERALALLGAAEELAIDDLDAPQVQALASTIEIDGETARQAQDQVEVTFERDSLVLKIEASGADAARAQALAQAVAHGYLDFRSDAATVATEEARQRLLQREQQLLDELDASAAEIERLERVLADDGPVDPNNPSASVRPAELRILELAEVSKRQNLAGIGDRLANIDAITINVGEILDDANLPSSPSGIPAPVGPVAGLLLGLGVGVGVAFVRDRSDATVRDPLSELPEMGSPILGFGPGTNHIAVTEGSAPDVDEAYRRTQAGLLFKMDRNDQQIVLVTGTVGAMDSDSAAVAAANLAVAAARVGRRTLLVLSDLRNPRIHQRFRLDNSKGLAEVINGKASLKEVSHQVPQLSTLYVLPPGDDLSSPTRLLQSSNMGRLLDNARSGFDLVVVEAPTLTDYADAVVLGPLCDTAILVVEPHRTRRSDLASAMRELNAVGINVSGTIVAESISTIQRKISIPA